VTEPAAEDCRSTTVVAVLYVYAVARRTASDTAASARHSPAETQPRQHPRIPLTTPLTGCAAKVPPDRKQTAELLKGTKGLTVIYWRSGSGSPFPFPRGYSHRFIISLSLTQHPGTRRRATRYRDVPTESRHITLGGQHYCSVEEGDTQTRPWLDTFEVQLTNVPERSILGNTSRLVSDQPRMTQQASPARDKRALMTFLSAYPRLSRNLPLVRNMPSLPEWPDLT
jgi:hypothetical protein